MLCRSDPLALEERKLLNRENAWSTDTGDGGTLVLFLDLPPPPPRRDDVVLLQLSSRSSKSLSRTDPVLSAKCCCWKSILPLFRFRCQP